MSPTMWPAVWRFSFAATRPPESATAYPAACGRAGSPLQSVVPMLLDGGFPEHGVFGRPDVFRGKRIRFDSSAGGNSRHAQHHQRTRANHGNSRSRPVVQ